MENIVTKKYLVKLKQLKENITAENRTINFSNKEDTLIEEINKQIIFLEAWLNES
jgi:hypothetical protein